MIQFNVLSEIIFKSEQVLKMSNDVLEMLYFCIGKKEGAFFWLIRHIYVCILNLKLYFERVEIFLWQFWHLCGCAGAGRGSSDCTSLCWTAWPGPGEAGGPACQEDTAARPQRPEREREREQLSVQPRQSASAEWPRDRQSVTITIVTVSRARHCHAPITLAAASVTHEPVRSSCGGQVWRRSGVTTSEARGRSHTPVSPSVPCDPPGCQHHITSSLDWPQSSGKREKRELVLVRGSGQLPVFPPWQSATHNR